MAKDVVWCKESHAIYYCVVSFNAGGLVQTAGKWILDVVQRVLRLDMVDPYAVCMGVTIAHPHTSHSLGRWPCGGASSVSTNRLMVQGSPRMHAEGYLISTNIDW